MIEGDTMLTTKEDWWVTIVMMVALITAIVITIFAMNRLKLLVMLWALKMTTAFGGLSL